MTWVKELIEYLTKSVRFVVFIKPWQKGIKVRAGKHQKVLDSGWHFMIPVIDEVYVKPIRLRAFATSPINIQTKDGVDVTISLDFGYIITDIMKIYNELHQPTSTIDSYIKGYLGEVVSTLTLKELDKNKICKRVITRMNRHPFGVEYKYIKVTNLTTARVLRLIQEKSWSNDSDDLDEKF